MFEKKINTIVEFAESYRKGTFGLYVATITDKKMNKYPVGTSRADMKLMAPNPYEGRVKTLAIYQNAASGKSYYNIVKAECERSGIFFTDEEFAAAFPKEKSYAESYNDKTANMLMQNEKNGQMYLRLYNGNAITKVLYYTLLDNEICNDPATLADIKRYIPAKVASQKQKELGISNIVECKNVKIENVILMGQSDKLYVNDRFANVCNIDLSNIKRLFN